MSKGKDKETPLSGPLGDDEKQNAPLNEQTAKKIKQSAEKVREHAHDVERNMK